MQRIEHGRSAWLRGRCRCGRCHRALLTYHRQRRAVDALRRGVEPATRIDPGRVRRHVEQLRADGWSLATIAAAAGVNRTTVDRIAYGYLKRTSRVTANLVLAVDGPPR